MDKYVTMDSNNPINCTEEQNLCEHCQMELTKRETVEDCYCENCDCCVQCGEVKEDSCGCKSNSTGGMTTKENVRYDPWDAYL